MIKRICSCAVFIISFLFSFEFSDGNKIRRSVYSTGGGDASGTGYKTSFTLGDVELSTFGPTSGYISYTGYQDSAYFPNSLTTLTALRGAAEGEVFLSWVSPPVVEGSTQPVKRYVIKYNTVNIDESNWMTSTLWLDTTTVNPPSMHEQFIITGLTPGVTYYIAVKAIDDRGNASYINTVSIAAPYGNGALISEVAPFDAAPNKKIEIIITRPAVLAGIKIYGRTATNTLWGLIKIFPSTGIWATELPQGHFVVINLSGNPQSDEFTLGASSTNLHSAQTALVTTDNVLTLSDRNGISTSNTGLNEEYLSGNVIDTVMFANPDNTNFPLGYINTIKKYAQKGYWLVDFDTNTLTSNDLAIQFYAVSSRGGTTGHSIQRKNNTLDTNKKSDLFYITSQSIGATNGADTTLVDGSARVIRPTGNILGGSTVTVEIEFNNLTQADNVRHSVYVEVPSGWTVPQTSYYNMPGFTTGYIGSAGATNSGFTSGYSISVATLTQLYNIWAPVGDMANNQILRVIYGSTDSSASGAAMAPTVTGKKTYDFRVFSDGAGHNAGQIVNATVTLQVVDELTPPAAITSFVAYVGTGSGNINLEWSSTGDDGMSGVLGSGSEFRIMYTTVSTSAESYTFWSTSSAQIIISTSGVSPQTKVNWTVSALLEGVTYFFRIWTKDDVDNWSDISNGATNYASVIPPGAVNDLYASTSSITPQGTINLTWTVPGDDGYTGNIATASYQIQYTSVTTLAENVSNFDPYNPKTTIGVFSVTVSTNNMVQGSRWYYDLSNLQVNTVYYIRVWHKDESNTWSGISNASTAPTPAPPPEIEAMIVYFASGTMNPDPSRPAYITYDGTSFGTTNYALSVSIGQDVAEGWYVLRRCPLSSRPKERILGTQVEGANDTLTFQVFDGSGWGNKIQPVYNLGITGVATNPNARKFDIAYEQSSGRAVVVFESTATGYPIYYTIWDGTSWTTPQNTNISAGTDRKNNLILTPKPGGDEMILLFEREDTDQLIAAVWNGTSWGNVINLTPGTGETLPNPGATQARRSFDCAYEANSGTAVIVFAVGNVAELRYIKYNNNSWFNANGVSTYTAFTPTGYTTATGEWIRLKSIPYSNNILLALFEEGAATNSDDLIVGVWISTNNAFGQFSELDLIALDVETSRGFDLAVELNSKDGIVVWGDSGATQPKYSVWKIDTGWSAPQNTNLPAGINSNWIITESHYKQGSDLVFVVAGDPTTNIYRSSWSGTAFADAMALVQHPRGNYENFAVEGGSFPVFAGDVTPPAGVNELTALTGDFYSPGTIKLSWTAPGDDGNTGNITGGKFRIKYTTVSNLTDADWDSDSSFNQFGYRWKIENSTDMVAGQNQGFTLTGLLTDKTTYYIRLWHADEVPNWSAASIIASTHPMHAIYGVLIETVTYDFGSVKVGGSTRTISAIPVKNNGNSVTTWSLSASTQAPSPWVIDLSSSVDRFVLRAGFYVAGSTPANSQFGDEDKVMSFNQASDSTRFAIDGTTGASVPVNDYRNLWILLEMPTVSTTDYTQTIIFTVTGGAP